MFVLRKDIFKISAHNRNNYYSGYEHDDIFNGKAAYGISKICQYTQMFRTHFSLIHCGSACCHEHQYIIKYA